jgi:hypothetical protein
MSGGAVASRLGAAILLLAACAPGGFAGFSVEVRMRDGRMVTGRTAADSVSLTLTVLDDEVVDLELRKPEDWSSLTTAGEVQWIPERSVYCIRGASFTAEAKEIRSPLPILDEAGRSIELSWRDVLSARFSVR